MPDNNINKSIKTGEIGTENMAMSDLPFYIPKQNIKFFNAMQQSAAASYGKYGNYPNLDKKH